MTDESRSATGAAGGLAAVAVLLAVATATGAQDCGAETPCRIDGGTYRIALPADPQDAPVVVFLHGFGSSGAGTMRMTEVVEAVTARSYAFVAPDGQPRDGGNGLRWDFRGASADRRDEDGFLRDVLADAVDRFGLDPERAILAGFSNGAFQTAYQACRSPGDFDAFAPVSGTFWVPQPESCAGPVRLFQTHGWRDGVVPLEGRPLGERAVQGDVFEGLDLWRRTNFCARDDPQGFAETGTFQRRHWDCAPGSALELALFPGGHQVPGGWAAMMLDWYEALPGG